MVVNTWKKAVAPSTMKDLRYAEISIVGMSLLGEKYMH
jgi:hypothetical protein